MSYCGRGDSQSHQLRQLIALVCSSILAVSLLARSLGVSGSLVETRSLAEDIISFGDATRHTPSTYLERCRCFPRLFAKPQLLLPKLMDISHLVAKLFHDLNVECREECTESFFLQPLVVGEELRFPLEEISSSWNAGLPHSLASFHELINISHLVLCYGHAEIFGFQPLVVGEVLRFPLRGNLLFSEHRTLGLSFQLEGPPYSWRSSYLGYVGNISVVGRGRDTAALAFSQAHPVSYRFMVETSIWLAWAGLSGPGYKPGPPCRWLVREHMPPCSRACARSRVDLAGFLFPAIRGKGRVEAPFRGSFLFLEYGNPASHTGGGTVFRGGSSLFVFSKTTPRLGVISPLRGVELSLGGRFTYPLSPRWGDL